MAQAGRAIRVVPLRRLGQQAALDAYQPEAHSIRDSPSQKVPGMLPTNNFDFDLFSGIVNSPSWLEVNGIEAGPVYDPVPQFDAAAGTGVFTLGESSPGYDAAIRVPNFNDSSWAMAPTLELMRPAARRCSLASPHI